jgi:hypothetical protein
MSKLKWELYVERLGCVAECLIGEIYEEITYEN